MINTLNLPIFFIIGAGKAGTSSIHEYLRQHPLISLPVRKETHFFICDKNSNNFIANYEGRKLKDTIENISEYLDEFEKKTTAIYRAEVCPSYLFYPNAPENIQRYVPNAKIICILRNPVDRLYSNFTFASENKSIELFATQSVHLPEKSDDIVDFYRWYRQGFYFEQLERYYSKFPKENIKIFLYNELLETPELVLKQILDFVGIPQYKFNTSLRFNISGRIRSKFLFNQLKKFHVGTWLRKHLPFNIYQFIRGYGEKIIFRKKDEVPPEIRKKLTCLYKEDILKLQDLIDIDLYPWL